MKFRVCTVLGVLVATAAAVAQVEYHSRVVADDADGLVVPGQTVTLAIEVEAADLEPEPPVLVFLGVGGSLVSDTMLGTFESVKLTRNVRCNDFACPNGHACSIACGLSCTCLNWTTEVSVHPGRLLPAFDLSCIVHIEHFLYYTFDVAYLGSWGEPGPCCTLGVQGIHGVGMFDAETINAGFIRVYEARFTVTPSAPAGSVLTFAFAGALGVVTTIIPLACDAAPTPNVVTMDTPVHLTVVTGTTPPADDCDSAMPIGVGTYVGTTVGATPDGAGSCAPAMFNGPDVWYSFTAPEPGRLFVNTCGSAYDTLMAIHGICQAASVACSDDCDGSPCGGTDSCTSIVMPTAGLTRFIRVGGRAGVTGTYRLNVSFVPAPRNDNCSGAMRIQAGQTPLDNSSATAGAPSGGPGNCETIQADLWYRFTSTCGGPITVSLCGSSFDSVLAVYPDMCPTEVGQAIACNEDSTACAPQSSITFTADVGGTYRIRVGSNMGGSFGAGVLDITSRTPPPNDACASAMPVADGSIAFSVCEAAGTPGIMQTGCGFSASDADVWFRYAPPATTDVTVSLCGNAFDSRVAVYGAECPSSANQAIACNNDSCGMQSSVTFAATAGQQYLIRVGRRGPEQHQPPTPYEGTLTITSAPVCAADFNGDGLANSQDFFDFLISFFAGCP